MSQYADLTVNGQALWHDLTTTAAFGGTAKGGICRLALSDEDFQVRAWFEQTCKALGCTVTHDSMGNQFARRAGLQNDLPPIMMGSHLDTQVTGGRFDGILGVLGGIAVLRALHDAGIHTRHSIEVVNWTNEEGARFRPPMLASGVFGGAFTEEFASSRTDATGITLRQELERGGFVGEEHCGQHPAAAYFELHIEQGPVLEAKECTIGVVTGVQGMRWYEVVVRGRSAHAGTTPMPMRKDALLAAARMIDQVNAVAQAYAPDGLSTIGIITAFPASSNVVPREVRFTVDLRNPSEDALQGMEEDFLRRMQECAQAAGVEVSITPTWNSPAVHFDKRCVACVRESGKELNYSMQDIVSGAGHDAVYVSRVVPTAMIFVPCWQGISHNEAESATQEDATAGSNVMLHAVLKADQVF
ncbi:M20 family metallo-hydrolase [Acetobacter sp. A11-2]|uniref:M20 family metallo-hydrolase n=1 Tax=Acetobacter sp. A11-2 TaxID=3157859 RepID=UPI0032ECF8B2